MVIKRQSETINRLVREQLRTNAILTEMFKTLCHHKLEIPANLLLRAPTNQAVPQPNPPNPAPAPRSQSAAPTQQTQAQNLANLYQQLHSSGIPPTPRSASQPIVFGHGYGVPNGNGASTSAIQGNPAGLAPNMQAAVSAAAAAMGSSSHLPMGPPPPRPQSQNVGAWAAPQPVPLRAPQGGPQPAQMSVPGPMYAQAAAAGPSRLMWAAANPQNGPVNGQRVPVNGRGVPMNGQGVPMNRQNAPIPVPPQQRPQPMQQVPMTEARIQEMAARGRALVATSQAALQGIPVRGPSVRPPTAAPAVSAEAIDPAVTLAPMPFAYVPPSAQRVVNRSPVIANVPAAIQANPSQPGPALFNAQALPVYPPGASMYDSHVLPTKSGDRNAAGEAQAQAPNAIDFTQFFDFGNLTFDGGADPLGFSGMMAPDSEDALIDFQSGAEAAGSASTSYGM